MFTMAGFKNTKQQIFENQVVSQYASSTILKERTRKRARPHAAKIFVQYVLQNIFPLYDYPINLDKSFTYIL